MSKHLVVMALASCSIYAASAVSAEAQTIGFDDLGTASYAPISDGYQGLNWQYFAVINGPNYGTSGYAHGVVSGQNVACGCASDFSLSTSTISSGSNNISLVSGYFTSAWNNGETLTVNGYKGAVLVDTTSFVINTGGPSFETFGWSGLSSVTFTPTGGTPVGLPGAGEYFALDNLSITATGAVPEPATWALMLTGFGIIGSAMRKRTNVRTTIGIA